MKILNLFFVLFLLVPVDMSALSEKQCRKIAERVDVGAAVLGITCDNPSLFWQSVVYNDDELTVFNKDILKNKGAEKDALGRMADLPKFNPEYDSAICSDRQLFCDSLLSRLGVDAVDGKCSLHVVYSDSINAFSVPVGDSGFAICLTTGLLANEGFTGDMLLGLVAREYVHGILRHNIRKFYDMEKQRRKRSLLSGFSIGYGGFVVGGVGGALAGGSVETPEYYIKLMNDESLLYTFRYTAEQEYEADVVALRFMQSIGLQDAMIAGVKLLGDRYDLNYSDWKEHPDVESRVDVLNYVAEKYIPKSAKKEKKEKTDYFEW